MRAVDRNGHQATAQLVCTLGARFETAHAMVDGVLDGPIVAELEMEHVVSLCCAPVAAVKMSALSEIDGCRDNPALVLRGEDERRAIECRPRELEELWGQIRVRALAPTGGAIEVLEHAPILNTELVAAKLLDAKTGFGGDATLFP